MADLPLPVLAVIDAIADLTPAQRRQLQRRLYASGLFVPETLLTDQNRLAGAPALGEHFLRQRARFVRAERGRAVLPESSTPAPRPQPAHPSAFYQSPVSGTVVLGVPETRASENDPHLMPPLPGQAPERPIGVIVEAGSYILRWPGEASHRVRLSFKTPVTEPEALYDTLIHVLEVIERRLADAKADPHGARVDIRSEDTLFVHHILNEPAPDDRLLVHRNKVRQLLQRFGGWRVSPLAS